MPQSGGLLLETVYYVVALMSLFDLSRVWEAWPQLTGSQVLRGLFQQAPIHSAVEEVRRVFMTRSHLFVASETHELGTAWPLANSPDDRRSHTGGDRLYAFSSSGGGDERDCCLPLEAGGGQVVSVACVAGCEDEVCVVRERGHVELFSRQGLTWRRAGAGQLSDPSDPCVCACTFHTPSNSVVYCIAAGHTHQVMLRGYQLGRW